ncbi:hypothetical protein CEXT_345241 [Caerostris extrusa]|uniref:Uncharacterized protein n=1 Tax=Caerostris extrusa TaxID=172846 RepID=A0AAV4XS16_CAEEX|nr:hypothetical protein CEXT_345241 [Caerostris extrusa]
MSSLIRCHLPFATSPTSSLTGRHLSLQEYKVVSFFANPTSSLIRSHLCLQLVQRRIELDFNFLLQQVQHRVSLDVILLGRKSNIESDSTASFFEQVQSRVFVTVFKFKCA